MGRGKGEGWREDTVTDRRFPLPMNLKIAPLKINDLRILRFQGFNARILRGILTPTLSPSAGERENRSPVGSFSRPFHNLCCGRDFPERLKVANPPNLS